MVHLQQRYHLRVVTMAELHNADGDRARSKEERHDTQQEKPRRVLRHGHGRGLQGRRARARQTDSERMRQKMERKGEEETGAEPGRKKQRD